MHPSYGIWVMMHQRCSNPKNKDYADYGARGITVCERWKEFPAFLADMGDKPNGMSLDRIVNSGNYEASNCQWSSQKSQMRNMRRNRMISISGETRCVSEWCEIKGISDSIVWSRIKNGWLPVEAILTPAHSPRGFRIRMPE